MPDDIRTSAVRLSADAFFDWVEDQPGRHELEHGEVVSMAPERARHAIVKSSCFMALRSAIHAAGVDCRAFPDGMSVLVDDETVYEPDASVQCGGSLDLDSVALDKPVIVVEVASPSTASRDAIHKLMGYARVSSIRHYVIVDPTLRRVIHFQLPDGAAGGEPPIETRIVADGALALDPPGLTLDVAALFADLPPEPAAD